MVLLGVILVLLAAAAGVLLFIGTAQLTDTVDIPVLGGILSLPPLTLLITGMVVITLFWLGWAMLRGGMRRSKRRRVEAKEAAANAEARRLEDERRMQDEFAARERQLVEERRQREAYDPAAHGDAAATRTGSADAGFDGQHAATTGDTRMGDPRADDGRRVDTGDTHRS